MVSRVGMHLLTLSRAQFAKGTLVHNPGQIRNGYVKEFIRRRFVFGRRKDEGGAKLRWLAEAFFRSVASPRKVTTTPSVANSFVLN